MHRARAFFYVSVGVFLLALSYHLGARSAGAQGPLALLAMTDYPQLPWAAVALDKAGGIYFGQNRQWSRIGTTPSVPTTVWTRNSSGEVFVTLENGDLYRLASDWSLIYDSNVFGGPTPADVQTWGAMKSRYRAEREGAQPAPQGR
ncbi:MAG TPA: hypothetical protein VJY35_05345 [Candidatus Eisenbacteria bacterium]|nr:hypothetical protein [Candidatus Eisenbacteria bacterium]